MNRFTHQRNTSRIIVRPLEKQDYAAWLSGFTNRLVSQHEYDPGKLNMSDCTSVWFDQLVDNHQSLALEDQAHVFAVFRLDDGTHLGMVDFSTLARDAFQWGRVGYTIHNQHWGQGYGTEAVDLAMRIAFDDLNFQRIEAHINLDNEASVRLAERVGMSYECTREGFIYENDEWVDHLVYVKTKHRR
ncbi:GNAT family N-acetyltransferase [Exiguobacterium aestuarii]|uniref:GNAT family N-acetyltransferase n=1 Tax=Exiguobacterium aestuarii TaxID=273527 RepID=A0ABW2PHF3_9BACL|nr:MULTISPECIES: GNAT family protein [Exiguobacterium]MCT4786818.1 GNAT family N-acetyltransferase [Exiguobacterium aestuarii]